MMLSLSLTHLLLLFPYPHSYSLCTQFFFLIGGENVAFLLDPGSHEINPIKEIEGPGVSLLPIGREVKNITSQVSTNSFVLRIFFFNFLYYYHNDIIYILIIQLVKITNMHI